jgi:hypothetical protein
MRHADSPPLEARREGFLVGAVVGAALAERSRGDDPVALREALAAGPLPLSPPPGRRHAAIALADGLLEELLGGGVDLRRLARRWVDWARRDGLGADRALVAALDHLEQFDAPPLDLGHRGPAAVVAALPAALAAGSPRAMVAGAFHTARLLDPDPGSGLAAVAVVVAAARLLEGSRDLMPDVLAMLRANEAAPELFDRFRAIVSEPGREPARPRGDATDAVTVAVWSLWITQHRPRSAEALVSMVAHGNIDVAAGATLGALLGARDGLASWPAAWLDGAGEEVVLRRAVAARLGQLPTSSESP